MFYSFLVSLAAPDDIFGTAQNTANMIMCISTTHAPVGAAYTYEITTPAIKQTIDTATEQTLTLLNFLNTRIEVSAGKMMSAEISIAPIMRIPSTIVIAVRNAMSIE
jgi:hypothetical protein